LVDESKVWIGLGNPCNEEDQEFFCGGYFCHDWKWREYQILVLSLASWLMPKGHCSQAIQNINEKKNARLGKLLMTTL
jgi:hypothetical protein